MTKQVARTAPSESLTGLQLTCGERNITTASQKNRCKYNIQCL